MFTISATPDITPLRELIISPIHYAYGKILCMMILTALSRTFFSNGESRAIII